MSALEGKQSQDEFIECERSAYPQRKMDLLSPVKANVVLKEKREALKSHLLEQCMAASTA